MRIKTIGSSLNYVGQARQRFSSLFLCASVVGSVNRGSPQSHGDTEISDSSSPILHSEEPFMHFIGNDG
jgi:hypothetical protein